MWPVFCSSGAGSCYVSDATIHRIFGHYLLAFSYAFVDLDVMCAFGWVIQNQVKNNNNGANDRIEKRKNNARE